MKIEDLLRSETNRLQTVFDHGEAVAAARAVFEDVAGFDQKYIFMHGDREMLDETAERLRATVDKIIAGVPVQYATGHARFCGYDFRVSPAVLIPRPETQQLVDMIADEADGAADLRVLDIATGSGCIACALAKSLRFPQVDALDISRDALAIARQNATDLGVKIDFSEQDILTATAPADTYNIIVSNPPYIARREAADMDKRVLDYEPHLALFVSDDDPLIFYRAIGKYAARALRENGRLYFEINPLFSRELCEMLKSQGYKDIKTIRDYIGIERFVTATIN
jgi:release factor glutamine methyltransferase